MLFNTTSRFLINIISPDIYTFIKSVYKVPVAVSPLMEHEGRILPDTVLCIIQLQYGKKIIDIYLQAIGFNEEIKSKFIKNLKEKIYETRVILNLFFKSDFFPKIHEDTDSIVTSDVFARIDLSVNTGDSDIYLSILMPLEFFHLFSGKIKNLDIDLIDKEIINYFHNPINLFPDLKIILETLSDLELQTLLHNLKKKKLLTPYQISLMLLSFPQHAALIKDNISSNTIKEVYGITKDYHLDRRDLIEGIYSIEESIYMLIRNRENFIFSGFMNKVQESLRVYLNTQSIIKRSFTGWIEEINSSGQLFYVLSVTREDDLLKIISENPDYYYSMLSKYLPKKRLDEIFPLLKNKKITIPERLEAQNIFISNYKKLKVKKLNMNHENFLTLLSKIDSNDMAYLLFGVGWFILSTALKNVNIKKIMSLIDKLPLGAKYLIIDVLQGTVNPNIIHDEMQINKARNECVNEIMSLYEEGIISL